MQLCIPIKENNGIDSTVDIHLGSAPSFLLFNNENYEMKIVGNNDRYHSRGTCHPATSLNGENVDVIIVGGIGSRAANKLNILGIKVFQSQGGIAKKNITLFNKGKLTELTFDNTCIHHGNGVGCRE